MITDNDVKKIEQSLIPNLLKAFSLVFATKEDLKEFMTREEMVDHLTSFRSDILSHVDAVYKELLDKRAEQAAHTHAHMRQDEKHEDHEKRIRKLEAPSTTP